MDNGEITVFQMLSHKSLNKNENPYPIFELEWGAQRDSDRAECGANF